VHSVERTAVRWQGRLETEATFLSLAESQLALAVSARKAVQVLRRLLRRVRSPRCGGSPPARKGLVKCGLEDFGCCGLGHKFIRAANGRAADRLGGSTKCLCGYGW
jgi:hypothetical protein